MTSSDLKASSDVPEFTADDYELQSQNLVRSLARTEIQAMQAYSSARSLAAAQGILLNANENPWPPTNSESDSNSDLDSTLNRYPEPQPQALVESLAALYTVDNQQLLLTRGSDEGIDLLVRAFCRAGQDSIAICPPCFGMYAIAAQIQNAGIHTIPLQAEQGFLPNFDALAQCDAKLIFLCSPNNPTGNLLPREQVLDLAKQRAKDAIIVVDEAYIEFSPDMSLVQALDRFPNLVILRTLSKAWALAGARLGILLAAPTIINLLRKILAPYPLPKPTITAVQAAINLDARIETLARVRLLNQERERLVQALSAYSFIQHIYPSAANFVLVCVHAAADLIQAAAAAGILLRDQSRQPGLANCIRISIGKPEENDALLDFFATYQPTTNAPE